MSFGPLFDAPFVIQIHALAALAAIPLGLVQFAAPKGTLPHRTLGWAWVLLMAIVAVSSLFIHTIRMLGPFSVIHLLSLLVIVTLPVAVLHAHRHQVPMHRRMMVHLFIGALMIAGVFTLWPGRIMHQVVFGDAVSAAKP